MADVPAILIVDDESYLRESLADYLEDCGYAVRMAESAEDGLAQLAQHPVDVCIVDMRLPGMTGNEFILQASAAFANLRFVIFTGSVDYALPQELRAMGLSSADILFKPLVDMQALLDKITTCMNT